MLFKKDTGVLCWYFWLNNFFLLSSLTWFWWWRLLFLGLTRSGLGNFFSRWCCAGWLWRGDWHWLGGLLAGLPGSWRGNLFGFRNWGRDIPFLALLLDGLSRRRFAIAFLGGRVLSCWRGRLLPRVHHALPNAALLALFLFAGFRLFLFLFHSWGEKTKMIYL